MSEEFFELVRSEVVPQNRKFNALRALTVYFEPLKRNGYFGVCTHLFGRRA